MVCFCCVQVGWEETTEAALTYLLRTCLARSNREAGAAVPALAPASDTQRLRKHLLLVMERLAKGGRLIEGAGGGKGGSLTGGREGDNGVGVSRRRSSDQQQAAAAGASR